MLYVARLMLVSFLQIQSLRDKDTAAQGNCVMHEQHWTASITPLIAVGVALLLGAGLIWTSGASVLEAYGGLFAGMCGSWPALSETGVAATPYILTGLAVALGFRGGVFNIGAEGQLYMGALGAGVVCD